MMKIMPRLLALLILAGMNIGCEKVKEPELKFLDGGTANWSDFSGGWVVVNYFAQWCAPCLREIPELNRFFAASENDSVRLMGVSFDALSANELADIQQKYQIGFPLLHPEYPNVMINKKPRNLPATFIISPDGEVVEMLLGEQTLDSLTHTIEDLKDAL